jgi:hypothetical protein
MHECEDKDLELTAILWADATEWQTVTLKTARKWMMEKRRKR